MLRKNLSTEHTEGTDHREFLVASLEILEEIFVKMLLTQEICSSSHRNLDGFRRNIFWLRERKKSLKEIFNKIWPVARNNLSLSLHKYNL